MANKLEWEEFEEAVLAGLTVKERRAHRKGMKKVWSLIHRPPPGQSHYSIWIRHVLCGVGNDGCDGDIGFAVSWATMPDAYIIQEASTMPQGQLLNILRLLKKLRQHPEFGVAARRETKPHLAHIWMLNSNFNQSNIWLQEWQKSPECINIATNWTRKHPSPVPYFEPAHLLEKPLELDVAAPVTEMRHLYFGLARLRQYATTPEARAYTQAQMHRMEVIYGPDVCEEEDSYPADAL